MQRSILIPPQAEVTTESMARLCQQIEQTDRMAILCLWLCEKHSSFLEKDARYFQYQPDQWVRVRYLKGEHSRVSVADDIIPLACAPATETFTVKATEKTAEAETSPVVTETKA
jgi:hypothetical protein